MLFSTNVKYHAYQLYMQWEELDLSSVATAAPLGATIYRDYSTKTWLS